ncbi:MAG: response regulator [Thermoanaerobaculia bacterium]
MARYLIIDDNVAFADNLAEIIADTGNDAVVVDCGARALELAVTARFDAVISDMRMPGMSGGETVRRLRCLDPGLPAIIVSAYTADDDLDRARHSGLLAILPKPVPIARLLELLAGARRDGLVVLVDDNEDLLESLSEALRQDGFSSVTARTVLETQSFGNVRPFAAIVDLRVAVGPDGEAMRQVAERFPALPVIVMTGHVGLAAPLPAVALFIKPFDVSDVVARLEQLHAYSYAPSAPALSS